MVRRAAALLGLSGLFLFQTACLEGFERLVTTLRYDPYTHQLQVERTLENIDPLFFGCADAVECVEAMEHALAGQSDPLAMPSLGDRLVQRLLETGALDVALTLERDGDALDIAATYTASLGTRAAEDTLVHVEFEGPSPERGSYRLVVAAQEGMEIPDVRYSVRKQSTSGVSGVDWRESWLLPPRKFELTTYLPVDEVKTPLFKAVPGLGDALAAAGWFGSPLPIGEVVDAPAVAVLTPPEPAPAVVEPGPEDTAAAEPASLEPAVVSSVAADPDTAEPVISESVAPDPVALEPIASVIVADVPSPESTSLESPPPEPPPPAAPPPARSAAPTALWPDPDPESPAKVYRHEPRITGPIPLSAVDASAKSLLPLVEVCYQRRFAERPELAGYAFLNAAVRGDGFIVSTSVYGEVEDPPLLRCLEKVVEAWRPPAPTGAESIGDISLPFTFRVEADDKKKGRRKR
jgi:hypothetical protein